MTDLCENAVEKNGADAACEMIRELPTGVLRWYSFKRGARALFLGSADDKIRQMLSEDKQLEVDVSDMASLMEPDNGKRYDYIICIRWLEKMPDVLDTLIRLRSMLRSDGILLLGMNNRLGVRYFIGDKDPYTGRVFDGIENYRHYPGESEDTFCGRTYSKDELNGSLSEAGFSIVKFYSVLSDLDNPMYLYADGYLPNEDLSNRLFPTYNSPDTVFLDEISLYQTLLDNGLFHKMANAYLIECTSDGKLSDALHVTCSIERGRKDAMITVIHGNDTVTKQAVYPEGAMRLQRIAENSAKLKARGIKVIEGTIDNDIYTMPFIKGDNGQLYLKNLLYSDKEKFLETMDHFRDLIMRSSEIHEGLFIEETESKATDSSQTGNDRKLTMLLDEAMFDMVPLNSFYIDGDFAFYDQEFCFRDYPVNILIVRMIASFYVGSPEFNKIMPRDELFKRYGVYDDLRRWQEPEWAFLAKLRNKELLAEHNKKISADSSIIRANRLKMNYSDCDYRRIFIDIFDDADSKKFILFGSGSYARRFASRYAGSFTVDAVIDNDPELWGREIDGLEGIKIQSPDILKDKEKSGYRVMICIKDFIPVLYQLERMGIRDYAVFDPGREYNTK